MSPIRGLTDRRRLPRLGKIHLGLRVKPEGKPEYPRAVNYFVFDPLHPQYEELVNVFGEQPTELQIAFPLDDTESIASQWYRLYSQSRGLVCRGDGEVAMRMLDTSTGSLANRQSLEVENTEAVCLGRGCPDYGRRGCGEVMNLQFLLPGISGFGVWQIDTGSINSIMNINSGLDLVMQIFGRISMVPLILVLEPKEIISPEDGKRKTVRVLNLRSEDNMVEAAKKSRQVLLAGDETTEAVRGRQIDEEPPADNKPPDTTDDLPVPPSVQLPPSGDTAPFIDLPSVTGGDDVQPEDVPPANVAEFFEWMQARGKKFTPSWFYRCFSYTPDTMKTATAIERAYHETRGVMGW